MKTLGEKIRELREEHDLSLRELAKKVGTSAAFMSDVELGRRHPSEAVLQHIARRLGIAVKELREYDSRPPIKDMQRLAAANPVYGVLFRKVAETDDPQALIDYLEKRSPRQKKS